MIIKYYEDKKLNGWLKCGICLATISRKEEYVQRSKSNTVEIQNNKTTEEKI